MEISSQVQLAAAQVVELTVLKVVKYILEGVVAALEWEQ